MGHMMQWPALLFIGMMAAFAITLLILSILDRRSA